MLAGMSVDYYIRLERGNLSGASDSVLEALARALQLDDAERAHLFDLARAADAAPRARRQRRSAPGQPSRAARPRRHHHRAGLGAQRPRADVLAPTRSAARCTWPLFDGRRHPAEQARFTFLDPRAVDFYGDWERTASDMVAVLRPRPGATPSTADSPTSIGELSTRSEEFRTRWAAHNVLFHRTGRKLLHHPSSATWTSPTRRSTSPRAPA